MSESDVKEILMINNQATSHGVAEKQELSKGMFLFSSPIEYVPMDPSGIKHSPPLN